MSRQIGGRTSLEQTSLRRNPYSVAFDALGWVDCDSAATSLASTSANGEQSKTRRKIWWRQHHFYYLFVSQRFKWKTFLISISESWFEHNYLLDHLTDLICCLTKLSMKIIFIIIQIFEMQNQFLILLKYFFKILWSDSIRTILLEIHFICSQNLCNIISGFKCCPFS